MINSASRADGSDNFEFALHVTRIRLNLNLNLNLNEINRSFHSHLILIAIITVPCSDQIQTSAIRFRVSTAGLAPTVITTTRARVFLGTRDSVVKRVSNKLASMMACGGKKESSADGPAHHMTHTACNHSGRRFCT